MGRRGYSGNRTIFYKQYVTNPGLLLLSGTNIHKRPRNVANHVVQKSVSLHINYDEVSFPGYLYLLEKAHRSSGLAPGSTKRRKVMLAHERLSCAMHALSIKLPKHPAYLPSLDSRPYRAVVNYVAIAPVNCGKAGMKIIASIASPMYRDIERKRCIDTHYP